MAKLLFPFTSKNTDFDALGKFLSRLVAPDAVNCAVVDGAVDASPSLSHVTKLAVAGAYELVRFTTLPLQYIFDMSAAVKTVL